MVIATVDIGGTGIKFALCLKKGKYWKSKSLQRLTI